MLCYNIITNYNCNLNCSFCSQYPRNKIYYPSTNEIMKEIFIAKKNGFQRIGFDGGEVTLRNDLEKLISFSRKLNFQFIRIQTNGILLADKSFSKKLAKAGLDFCKFTFLSHNPKIHNYLVKNNKAFDLSLNGLENLLSLKIKIGINILLTKLNYINLKDTIKFFLKFGIGNFTIIYPTYYGKILENLEELKVSYEEIYPIITEIIKLSSKSNFDKKIKFLNIPICFLDNDFTKAFEYNRFKTILVEIGRKRWNIDEEQDKSKKIIKNLCSNCKYITKCKGINKDYISIFKNINKKPIKQNRKPERIEIFLTQDDNCIIRILKKYPKGLFTEKIIEKAKNISICKDCNDFNNLLSNLLKLHKKGIIKTTLINGKYKWKIVV